MILDNNSGNDYSLRSLLLVASTITEKDKKTKKRSIYFIRYKKRVSFFVYASIQELYSHFPMSDYTIISISK